MQVTELLHLSLSGSGLPDGLSVVNPVPNFLGKVNRMASYVDELVHLVNPVNVDAQHAEKRNQPVK